MFTLHKNQILMEYIFLSKQIVGFSNTTQIVGFSNGDDSEDLFLTKTLTNMKYPPNVIKNWYPRLTLRTNLCTKNMINSFQWWCCVCVCHQWEGCSCLSAHSLSSAVYLPGLVVTERWQPLETRNLQLFYGWCDEHLSVLALSRTLNKWHL